MTSQAKPKTNTKQKRVGHKQPSALRDYHTRRFTVTGAIGCLKSQAGCLDAALYYLVCEVEQKFNKANWRRYQSEKKVKR